MDARASARSREGHAASAGVADKWVLIQENTFRNWVNEQLRPKNMAIADFEKDFENGVKLCALITVLQGKSPGKVIQTPRNPHQELENVALALSAIANDNIRLVNIGADDVRTGNKKLIMGLIWHLILRYQIGKSKIPPKKLMLAWLKAVIPECHITNFTTDWNDGVALHALIEYCRPGLYPNWKQLGRSDRLENCRHAMNLAKEQFDIPMVVRPEDLSSSDLDELSGMTYLSYFMKLDSPGYHATLRNINRLLRNRSFSNFTTDWNDGQLLHDLVKSIGGSPRPLTGDPRTDTQNGIDAASALGIETVLAAQEMIDPEVDHIGNMAYAAYFTHFKPMKGGADKVLITSLPKSSFVGQETHFSIRLDDDASPGDVHAEVKGSDSTIPVYFNWSGKVAQGSFVPTETGHHQLNVYCEKQLISECPASFRVNADRTKIVFHGIDKCSVGELKELKVNTREAGGGDIQIEARSPSGRIQNLSTIPRNGNYLANFNPTEVGKWQISVCHEGEHINGSPFHISVFDPTAVQVYGLDGGTVGTGLSFHADATRAGEGQLTCKVNHGARTVSHHILKEKDGLYKIDFTPEGAGTYMVHVYYNGTEVRGSPYSMDILDSSKITVVGDGLSLVPVNKTAHFEVNLHGATKGTVEVEITSPTGRRVPHRILSPNKGINKVEYIPIQTGDHKINVLYGGQLVKGCPFLCKVYDAGSVVVSKMPSYTLVGNEVSFDIDASSAGSGNIEIMVNGGEIACKVQNHGKYRFTASFTPNVAEPHMVEMKFNSVSVVGSPWNISVVDLDKFTASGEGLEFVQVKRKYSFTIHYQGNLSDDLKVKITAPSGRNVPFKRIKEGNDFRVEYTPVEVGDHNIEVRFGNQELNGSPFVAKAYDTSAIKVTPPKDGIVGEGISFLIDVSKAGEGQLEIMVNDGNIPNQVTSDENGVYKMTFIPEKAGTQTVDIIFNKEHHPKSPLTCQAVDLSGSSVTGLKTEHPCNIETFFYVHSDSGNTNLPVNVEVLAPGGNIVPVSVNKLMDGRTSVTFTPTKVGTHTINVTSLGVHIGKSPYKTEVYNAKAARLSKMPLGLLGIPFKFVVFAEEAGEGQVEVSVEAEGKNVKTELTPLDSGSFEVSFNGVGEAIHLINILFNGEYISASPVSVNFVELDKLRIQKPETYSVPCNRQTSFRMTLPPLAVDNLSIKLIGPNGEKVPVKLHAHGGNVYTGDWTPLCTGAYYLEVLYGDMFPVWGSPMTFTAYDSTKVRIRMSERWAEDDRYNMTVDVAEAGPGNLEIVVMCDGETVQAAVEQGGDNLLHVSFDPIKKKNHTVYVSFNGEPVPGSPFIVFMEEEVSTDLNTQFFIVEELQWFLLHALNTFMDPSKIVIKITAPNGERLLADVYPKSGGDYKVEWTPRSPGRHTVDVQYNGRQVEGSPYYVNVFDLKMIRVDNFRHGLVGDVAGFSVDFSQAGSLEHNIRIISPSGGEVTYDTRSLGHMWIDVLYEPEEPGTFQIYITYAGFQLPGCPFRQEISDGGLPTASGDGLYFGQENKISTFHVDVGRRKGNLQVSVDGPNSMAKCNVDPQPDGTYTVTYIPVETGMFDVSVKWNGEEIPGSPYHPRIVDPTKVKIIGGWNQFYDSNERISLTVGELKVLPFDISEAGPGKLRADVSGPGGKISSHIEEQSGGRTLVKFTPEDEGNHYIHLFWSDLSLPNSPYHGYAVPVAMDANKVILTGRGLKEAIVREEAEFVIDGSQAGKGSPEVSLSGVRAEVNVKVISLGNGRYRCHYIPIIPGAYLLHISWNGRQLRGSPYKVNIIGAFYPNKVTVSGDGLMGGILGKEQNILIDTRRAGPGELTAHCMGPHVVAFCELEDRRDGTFRLGVRPQEPGRHVLQIKYGGEHVQGSPFTFKVIQQPDANRVRVTGPGVEHGILANFQSRFIVETRGAGAGQLTVRIRGPKGAFQVEMYRDSQRDRTILCRYDPVETGLYIISVKWSGVDVPGSPFQVHLVDTQQELEQVYSDHAYTVPLHSTKASIRAPQPVNYAQWREEL
ncbi:hypothetical protein CHS0354_015146 [Potamilus streckersoni]|uniref:Calponin-homology (CH) domain-containing protein n=1 Tax=Potamilus streckersoni TaxID=2493646 RepID=A0AAE0VT45_9BIVA|nr:hypothetical protein CHS0354_015146 [Potamilus streckersoni]